MKVAVTSKSFSKNLFLKEKLLETYPDSYFNDKGLSFNDDQLVEFLRPCDAAIVGLEKMTEKILSELPNLKIVSKYGVGLDNIFFDSLKKHNIRFGHTPGTNKRGVAELAHQMMLILIRKSFMANLCLRKGEWTPQFGNNLTNKKIGILGLGHVGKELVKLLAPYDCQITCCDIQPDLEFINQNRLSLVSIEELFTHNTVISIHVPLDESTQNLISSKLFGLMPAHSILINTSRGGIVDEAVLFDKLKNSKIAAAGFDVFSEEPCLNQELLTLNNFYATPHIGGSSLESVQAMGLAAISGLDNAQLIL